MYKYKIILLTVFFTLLSISCSPTSTNISKLASEDSSAKDFICSTFDSNGFEGSIQLGSPSDFRGKRGNTDSYILSLRQFPNEFEEQETYYIQLFGLNIRDNKPVFTKSPLRLDIVDIKTGSLSFTVKQISHKLIDGFNLSIRNFLREYVFQINNIVGNQAIVLGLFNDKNEQILNTQVLIPPFQSDPYSYKSSNHTHFVSLHPLHGFIGKSNENTKSFFTKQAHNICSDNIIL